MVQPKKEHIYHFTNVLDFEYICLEKKGGGFPELEEVVFNYVLSMPQGTLEFKECWISREYVEGEDVFCYSNCLRSKRSTASRFLSLLIFV